MFPFLQVFAMTDAATASINGSSGSTASSELPDFPGEHPTDKDLSDWLDTVMPRLRRLYGALLRGETPQHLLQYENGADDLSGYTQTGSIMMMQLPFAGERMMAASALKQQAANAECGARGCSKGPPEAALWP